MNEDFMLALEQIEKEKRIPREVIFEALESALISSYKKNFSANHNVSVDVNRENGQVKMFALKDVVEHVENQASEISLEEARAMNPTYEVGDIYKEEVTPKDFGRIAAQTAKQVVIQRIKDAERDMLYEEFIDRENEIITGQVQRVNRGNVYIDLGKTEAILPPSEQIAGEDYTDRKSVV